MESEDYHFYQGLVYLLENDVSTLGYDLTFSTEVSWEIYLGNTLELTVSIEKRLVFIKQKIEWIK